MPSRSSARLLTAVLLTALSGAVVVPAASADAPAPGRSVQRSVAPVDGSSKAAQARTTLAEATSLFARRSSARGRTATPRTTRDATMVLRDLAHRAANLPTADERATAQRILARPTDPGASAAGEPQYDGSPVGTLCDATLPLCVHWEEADATTPANNIADDGDVATVPAYVRTVLATLDHVYTTETGTLGYRPPRSDNGRGGDNRTDIYLAELGDQGLYGYCAPEGSAAQTDGYCVLDNDYSAAEYGSTDTPLENLQVTAAHEFFHAIQFGYDSNEDTWFMEGTAVWMEDEVYDSVNDNLQYLRSQNPITDPYIPIDYIGQVSYPDGTTADYSPYGSWVFWKFLSEHAASGSAADPRIIRQVWEHAQSTYSTNALKQVLAAKHTSFAKIWDTFGTWVGNPAKYFTEGRSYPSVGYDRTGKLSKSRTTLKASGIPISHMTHSFTKLTPASNLGSSYRLKISVDMAGTSHGSAARYVVHYRSGKVGVATIKLSASGKGSRTLGFSHHKVSFVQLDLAGTSTRFTDCGTSQPFSCGGSSPDDDERAKLTAHAYKS